MLNILKSGFFTTVQDIGRFGYRDKGVPVAGVMDSFSVSKVNTLLENEENCAVLEITMTGPTLEFEQDTYIVLGGAEMSVTLNETAIENYTVYKVKSGDILTYGKLLKGFRAYLGIKDGFDTASVLGSRSFFKPITEQDSIKKVSGLPYAECKQFNPKISELKVDSVLYKSELEVYKGPEYGLLTDKQLAKLFYREFSVANENNRMAYQLNEVIDSNKVSMLTSATLPGTIQLTPAGKLIILMKDGQTTGGYPRILQLSDMAMSILAQKRSGDLINFKLK
ncbi:biotin-dependent carboxyltransferase family protein [Arenibacter sp. F20364]|uniref:5-oxoprolinase subunit C family protein n=1 Tax=Arenibacter sp. F20364 TaxID=2926415 RepID=UPI001FF2C117|nr:biotin-dependent carboxyltransferase family protein [Arenibacter sp. F20364]MCK0192145.1 biotin-dependent carboxyltransferase family protein [Arenibacter sp. F20364]